MEMVCLIFVTFHAVTSLQYLLSSIYMLPVLLSKHEPPAMLTHAVKTVFGMALPSRNRGLGKGRAAKRRTKMCFIILESLGSELGAVTHRKHALISKMHSSPQSTKPSSHPKSAQN